ncbi:MAG: RagB/SusD family nutrient uptake outer membrane protein [Cyclobacteriaceae bacterium]
MKKYMLIAATVLVCLSSCDDFLTLQPEYLVNENTFYKSANDFETALIGNYSALQGLHDASILYLGELTTDNAEIQWTSPTTSEMECDEMNLTSTNTFANAVWNSCFTTISRCNNILSRIASVDMDESLKSQYRGEALFLRAYNYFYLVRLFGDVPIVEESFRSPGEIAAFDMARKPASEVYQIITGDLMMADDLLQGVTGLSKSRASAGAAKTLLGKVYLTRQDYPAAATELKEVIDRNTYSLEADYKSLFTNGNDELGESIFEIKYLSGNLGEGNSFSSVFTPPRFDMAIFPGNMQGSGRIVPTADVVSAYEPGDVRRAASIADSVQLVDGTSAANIYGLKFVDFTTGVVGDGGINFTALRYADVLLMYAEALNETGNTADATTFLNRVRDRAGLPSLSGLSGSDFALALEQERRVEFLGEGHRWFDLVRTGRAQTVLNDYFADKGLNFSVAENELLMPIPQNEIDIDPNLVQNTGY